MSYEDIINKDFCFGYNYMTKDLCKKQCKEKYLYCDECYGQRNVKDNYFESVEILIKINKELTKKESKIKLVKKIINFFLLNKKLINSLKSYKKIVMNKINEFVKEDKSFNYYLDEKIWDENYKPNKLTKTITMKINQPIVIDTEQYIFL